METDGPLLLPYYSAKEPGEREIPGKYILLYLLAIVVALTWLAVYMQVNG